MATITLFSQPQKAYLPKDSFTQPFAVAPGTTLLRATFTRPSWPIGTVAKATLTWSNGEQASIPLEGVSGQTFNLKLAQGVPAGVTNGTLIFEVLQGFQSAITVEADS